MIDENVLTSVLNVLQYERAEPLTYRANWSAPEVEHFVYFSVYGPQEQFLTADFGLKNPTAEDFSFRSILKYGGIAFKRVSHGRTDCLMRFSFQRFRPATTGWSLYLPEFSCPELAQIIGETIREHLLPAVCRITDLAELSHVLLADKEPYPWVCSNGAIRAAQYVAVAMQLGLPPNDIRAALSSREGRISGGGVGDAKSYINSLISDWNRDFGLGSLTLPPS